MAVLLDILLPLLPEPSLCTSTVPVPEPVLARRAAVAAVPGMVVHALPAAGLALLLVAGAAVVEGVVGAVSHGASGRGHAHRAGGRAGRERVLVRRLVPRRVGGRARVLVPLTVLGGVAGPVAAGPVAEVSRVAAVVLGHHRHAGAVSRRGPVGERVAVGAVRVVHLVVVFVSEPARPRASITRSSNGDPDILIELAGPLAPEVEEA